MNNLTKVINKTTSILAIFSYVAFCGIVVLTVCDIVIRSLSTSSILGAYELVEKLMLCGVFASFAYTQSEHGHVQITLLLIKMPVKLQFILMTLHNVLSCVVTVMVAYGAYNQAITAYRSHYTTGVLLIPTYPFYWFEIICMAILFLAFALDGVKCAIGIFKTHRRADIQQTWLNAG